MMLGHEQPFPAARLVRRTGRTGHSIAWGQHTEETEYNLTGGKNAVTDYSYNGNPGCTAGDPTSAACRNTGGSGGGCPDYDPGCPGFTGGGAGPSGEKIGGYTGRPTPSSVITASPQPVELQAIYLTALTRMWETPQAAPVYAQWEALAAACEQDEGLCAAGSVTTALDQIGIAQLQYQQAIDRGPRPSLGQILDATGDAASLISLAIAPEILGPEDAIAAGIGDITADTAGDATTQIFRNVGSEEFNSIASTDRFSTAEGQMEGKWFATQGEHAEQWGELLNNGEGLTVETRIPQSVADQLYLESGKLDGVGPGYYANSEQLDLINQTMDGIRVYP
jgi:hypothetical protein